MKTVQQTDLEKRYNDPKINRQFFLSDALIHMRSYSWGLVDKVAGEASDADIAAFCRIVEALNKETDQ